MKLKDIAQTFKKATYILAKVTATAMDFASAPFQVAAARIGNIIEEVKTTRGKIASALSCIIRDGVPMAAGACLGYVLGTPNPTLFALAGAAVAARIVGKRIADYNPHTFSELADYFCAPSPSLRNG